MSPNQSENSGSLLPGRNVAPLDERDIRRAMNTFLGIEDRTINISYQAGSSTRFLTNIDEQGIEFGEIIIGPDIYPGQNIIDSNSILSLNAAAAHELSHYHRWQDRTELPHGEFTHLDEALTSLEAISRYSRKLNEMDTRQLVADAAQRIKLHISSIQQI